MGRVFLKKNQQHMRLLNSVIFIEIMLCKSAILS